MTITDIENIYRNQERFERIRDATIDVQKYSTYAIGCLINWFVEQMPADQCYLDIGTWQGFSLISGAVGNAGKQCIGVDDFSQTDGFTELINNIVPYKNIFFWRGSYQKYFQQHTKPIGVYHYDADHREDCQCYALMLARPFYQPGSIIIVDDWNWKHVKDGTNNFLKWNRDFKIVFEEHYGEKPISECNLWNGIAIIEKRPSIRKWRKL